MSRRHPHARVRRHPLRGGWGLAAPAVLVLAVVILWPLGRAIHTSLFTKSLTTPDDTAFAGPGNYLEVVTSTKWWVAVALSLVFVAAVVVIQLLLAGAFAAALRRITFIAPYTRVLVLVPFALMATVVAFVWREGVTAGFAPEWFHYSGDGQVAALAAVAAGEIWRGTGITTIILLAGLSRVPHSLLESAVADGATGRQRLTRIVLPAAAPAIAVAAVYRSLDAFRAFEGPLLAEPSLPRLRTAPLMLWDTTFTSFEVGLGAAMSIVLLALAGVLGVMLMLLLRVRRVL
ncbi:carbohydrate ABC transporter permease [Aeromicrobium sp.]|uniref:carbohydrate ABC transporter permease n=1 Tax=Aeromicrobium sp. TaxID=1871063 RepID=UPI003D6AC866